MDVATILRGLKRRVLRGCTVTFSGIIPTNEPRPQTHLLWRLAETLGAQVRHRTHEDELGGGGGGGRGGPSKLNCNDVPTIYLCYAQPQLSVAYPHYNDVPTILCYA